MRFTLKNFAILFTALVFLGGCRPGLRKSDLSASSATQGTAILLGDGTFSLGASQSVGGGAYSIVSSDFNGDGNLDVASANFADGTVSVILGNGDGTFLAQSNYVVGGASGPFGIANADFNGDGFDDLVVSKWGGTILVLLNDGLGAFTVGADVASVTAAFDIYKVVAKDLNNDGKIDIVIANCWAMTVSVMLGNGDGTFQPYVEYSVGGGSVGLDVGDMNNDGKPDIVTTQIGTGTVILIGNGDGTFMPATAPVADTAWSETLTLGDLNDDGNLDVVATNGFGSDIAVLLGNGDGTLQAAVGYATSGVPKNIQFGDFNADGKMDLATGTWSPVGDINIFLGNGDGTLQAAAVTPVSASLHWLLSGDFNGDGVSDLAVSDLANMTMTTYLGNHQ